MTDFDGSSGDRFQLFGDITDYALGSGNWVGEASQDTLIFYQDDLIALVRWVTS